MLKTIDDKIEFLRHTGIDNLPQSNIVSNLPQIENIVFKTISANLEKYDSDYCYENFELDGGCSKFIE